MKRTAAALLLACGVPLAAHAQAPGMTAATPPVAQSGVSAPAAQPVPANRWTLVQVREAFRLADVNGDGQLTRAEAQRLTIMPRSFEETDQNKDGLLTLGEYQASFAP